MTPSDTITAIKLVGSWLGSIVDWSHTQDLQRQAQTKAALTTLLLAASETRQYVAAMRRDSTAKDTKTEARLSALWGNAGTEMALVKPELGMTFLLKADYWSDREGWVLARKNEGDIDLDKVYHEGLQALLGMS